MEEQKARFNFGEFLKKSWFYIGIFLLVSIAIIALMSDKDVQYSGEVTYDEPFYYITGNNLYIKVQGRDAVLLSSTMFMDPESRSNNDAMSAVFISEGGDYVYFYENIVLEDDGAIGDFCVYHDNRKKLIDEDTGIFFAIADDSDTVVYLKTLYNVEGGSGYENVRYDLYKYNFKDGRKLVEKGVEPSWFTISGDGRSIIYTKFYDAATDTSSLFINRDGNAVFVDDHMFFYGEYLPKGTFRVNWPYTNYDASKLVYGKRMKYGELADLYLYSGGTPALLGEDVLQVFCDESMDAALIIENYKNEVFVGDVARIDLNTLSKEMITTDAWGLGTTAIARMFGPGFVDLGLYMKDYNDVINVADVCMMTPEGEKILINATDVSNIQFAEDYSTMFGLDYYVPEEGGRLTKIVFGDAGAFEKYQYDEFVKEFYVSKSGKYTAYKQGDDLFYINPSNEKKYVDKLGVVTFGIMEGDEKIYFFKETSLGMGNVFVKDITKSSDLTLIAEGVHYAWDYGDGKMAFLTNFDFGASTGTMYITDCEGKYEVIAENMELPLYYNYIN
ncbi:MAG: hypothetical protein JXB33_04690 [Clostridia bacterium]|nr:hypothetical protein [Clostridia bacterium]